MFHFGEHRKSQRSLQQLSKVAHEFLVNYCVLCTDFFLYTVTPFLKTTCLFTQLKLMLMKNRCLCSQVTKQKCQICVNLHNLSSFLLHFCSFHWGSNFVREKRLVSVYVEFITHCKSSQFLNGNWERAK